MQTSSFNVSVGDRPWNRNFNIVILGIPLTAPIYMRFNHQVKMAYENYLRALRLIDRGYSPERAVELCSDTWSGFTMEGFFKAFYVEALHDTLTDETPDVELVCEGDGLTTDWLTDAYAREFGLGCGEEASVEDIAHYFAVEFGNEQPPRWLTGALQAIDETSGDFVGSHHLSNYQY